MKTLPSRPWDDETRGVTLTPLLAKEVARALRIQLACELDRPLAEPLSTREDGRAPPNRRRPVCSAARHARLGRITGRRANG